MPSAIKQRLQQSSLPHVQRTGALRAVHLVPGDGQQVATDLLHVQRNLARRLDRVRVEVNIGFGGDLSDLVHRLQDASLVIRQDDADELRLRPKRAANIIRINQGLAVYRQVGHGAAHLLQPLAGVQHGMMLNRGGDDVIARLHQAEQGQVVAFGAAAGEDYLGSATVQQLGNMFARALDRRPCLLSLLMNGRGVPELLEEVGTHRLKHFGQKRAGGVVVEIHPAHPYLG